MVATPAAYLTPPNQCDTVVVMSATESVSYTVRMPRKLVEELDRLAKRELSSRNRELQIAARAHIDASKGRAQR
jgi:metal-responsive CopG/Arc/MetJ family transcriptional regulator